MAYKSIDKFIIGGRNLQDILDDHKKWLSEPSSENAHLRADLSGIDLSGIDLSGIDLSGANLSDSIMVRANLSGANLSDAIMRRADLSGAIMRRADLSGAIMEYAIMRRADLSGANLSDSIMVRANLSAIIYNSSTAFFPLQCPEKGSFTGFKKCGDYIVELKIPANALRSSATSRKCRCSAAKVISITEFDGSDSGVESVTSNRDSSFITA